MRNYHMNTENARKAINESIRHNRQMQAVLNNYISILESKNGAIYDARVIKIDNQFSDAMGCPVKYYARIEQNFSVYRLYIYSSILDDKGCTIWGTKAEISGEFLGASGASALPVNWIYAKEGKNKLYFNALALIEKIKSILTKLENDITESYETLDNLQQTAEKLAELSAQRDSISEQISKLTNRRAYFNNKNLGELLNY